MMSTSTWDNPLLPVLKVQRLLGRIPFTVKDSGHLECRLVSFASLWVLLCIAAQTCLVIKVHFSEVSGPSSLQNFNDGLTAALKLLYFDGLIFSLTTTWWTAPSMVRAYNKWCDFHVMFEASTNRTITSNLLNHPWAGVSANTIFVYVVMRICATDEDRLKNEILAHVIFFYIIFYLTILLWQWIILCTMVKKAADIIRESISERRDVYSTSQLRLLWLELRACTVAFAQAVGRTMALWLLVNLYDYVVVIYATVIYIMDFDIVTHFIVLFDTVYIFAPFFFGSWAAKSIHDNIIKTLYAERWSKFSESEYREVDRFLSTVKSGQPYFEILGILTFDKPAYISMLETINTYLVVLVQFNQISPEDDND